MTLVPLTMTPKSTVIALHVYRIFLRIADFDPENMVQQPINGLLLVEHENELNNEVQVRSLEHFSCGKENQGIYRHSLVRQRDD